MMVLLTKEEYDDLIKKAHASDMVAEEKLETLKSQLAERIFEVFKKHSHWTDPSGLRHNPVLLEVAELLKHYA